MSRGLRPPVIVIGNTRSGTSVVQNLLAEHPDVVAWYEPRNVWQYADPARSHDEFDASDATDRVRRYVRRRFLAYQRRHGDRIIVEKTPVNVLRIPYVRAILPEATLIYVVRNPFSFVSSVEAKWQRTVSTRGVGRRLKSTPLTQLHYYAGQYIRQQYEKRVLRRKYLSVWGPRYRGIAEDVRTQDLLTVIARQWAVGSRLAESSLADLGPDRLLRLRYEDVVEDPVGQLERMSSYCGLDVTDEMRAAARQRIHADRQDKWRRFDPRELAALLPELEEGMRVHRYLTPPEIDRYRSTGRREDSIASSAEGPDTAFPGSPRPVTRASS